MFSPASPKSHLCRKSSWRNYVKFRKTYFREVKINQ